MGADGSGGGKRPEPGDPLGDTQPAQSDALDPILRRLAHAPTPRSFISGDAIGRFEIQRELGRGGFGVVYEARDGELGRKVALKMIASADPAFDDGLGPLLRREAATAARLNHPNIVTLYDLGVWQGGPYLVLELLEGETLAQRLSRGPLEPAATIEVALAVAHALVHAHRVGVIHRDLKPSNVFLTRDGGIKVLDLGLARLMAAVEGIRSLSVADAGLHGAGTPAYMAPEQWRAEPGDERTDIFSLGVTLYECLSGSLPFDVAARGRQAVVDDREAPRLTNVPPGLAQVIATSLAKDPARRFASARALLDALESASGTTRARRRWLVAAAALVAVVAVGVGTVLRARHSAARSAQGAATPSRKSVAVLGFKNLSGRGDVGWVSTALMEMISTELGLGDRLRTVPGEKVARAKSDLSIGDADGFEPDTLARLRKNLASDYVVLGSYLDVGSTVRVDLRLQDTQSGETVASFGENGTENDLAGLVGRVGGRLRARLGAGGLSASETTAARRSMPSNAEAARDYAEGLDRYRQFDPVAARALLERAVTVEPDSPLPHAALAEVYAVLGFDTQARSEAKQAFERSTELSREERLSIEARYRQLSNDRPKAIELYNALVDYYPDNIEYGLGLAAVYRDANRVDDSLAALAKLRRRLPEPARDDPRIDLEEALSSNDAKRGVELARQAARKGQALGARLLVARARGQESTSLVWAGDFDAARKAAELAQPVFDYLALNPRILDRLCRSHRREHQQKPKHRAHASSFP